MENHGVLNCRCGQIVSRNPWLDDFISLELSTRILFPNGFLEGGEEELAVFFGEHGAELAVFSVIHLNHDGDGAGAFTIVIFMSLYDFDLGGIEALFPAQATDAGENGCLTFDDADFCVPEKTGKNGADEKQADKNKGSQKKPESKGHANGHFTATYHFVIWKPTGQGNVEVLKGAAEGNSDIKR